MNNTEAINVGLPYKYQPRDYQIPLWKAFDNGCKRFILVWHRRSGKDKSCLNLIAREMQKRVGNYYYFFDTLKHGKKVIWEGKDKTGFPFLSHFPKELVNGKPNETECKIKYHNTSLFQLTGTDEFDKNSVGTNPVGCVLSEYSLQSPTVWGFLSPILNENNGWVIFNFTPRGENHAYDLYKMALDDPFDKVTNPDGWTVIKLSVEDTKAIPENILKRERNECIRLYGNDALYRQEYECDFSVPISGAYYAEQILQSYAHGQIGQVNLDVRFPVDTWWDIGRNDRNSIWFTQSVGTNIHLIDFYENSGQGLPHYAKVIKDKGYLYRYHTGPHDLAVTEWGTDKQRLMSAKDLGINFRVCPKISISDGIDAVRSLFPKCWFDAVKCKDGLNALKSYHKAWNEDRKTYENTPYHDWSSNAADAFRYLAVGLNWKENERIANSQKDKWGSEDTSDENFSPMAQ